MRNFILLLTLLSCGFSHAQEQAKTRNCRILFLDRPSDAPRAMHLFDGENSREVDLPGMNLSKEIEIPSGARRLFLVSNPINNMDQVPAGAPSLIVPEDMADFYLLLFQDRSNKISPISMQLVDASMQRLGAGQTLWFNLTNLTIGGKLGSENLLIQPMSRKIMSAPRQDIGDYSVKMAYRKDGEEVNYPICETSWTHDPRVRSLGFIVTKEGVRTPRVFQIPDFRMDEARTVSADVAMPD